MRNVSFTEAQFAELTRALRREPCGDIICDSLGVTVPADEAPVASATPPAAPAVKPYVCRSTLHIETDARAKPPWKE